MVATWTRFSQSVGYAGLFLAALAGPRAATALTVVPVFDSSITGAANAIQLEAAITDAAGIIGSLYSNPGSVGIVFNQAAGNFLGQSQSAAYAMSYASYVSALSAASLAQTTNGVLATAVAHLATGNKPGPGGSVVLTSADARVALGLPGYSGCYNSSGTFVGACGQQYDGVVTLSTSQTLNYGRSPMPGAYSVINAIEHEINEVLGGGGQGTVLNKIAAGNANASNNVGVLDLYRYAAQGVASFSTSTAVASYFSIDGGATAVAAFYQGSIGDLADFSGGDAIQSAIQGSGDVLTYDRLSPEFTMLELIGYAGTVAEPAGLVLLATGLAGLGAARLRVRLIQ